MTYYVAGKDKAGNEKYYYVKSTFGKDQMYSIICENDGEDAMDGTYGMSLFDKPK